MCEGTEESALKSTEGNIQEITVICDADGCDLVLANNPKKGIACYYFGRELAAMNGTFISMKGENLTAGIDAEGYAYVFVLRDNKVYYAKEKRAHSGEFESERCLEVSHPEYFKGISQIEAIPIKEGFAFFAVCETTKETAYISCRLSGDNNDYLMPVAFACGKFAFTGAAKDDLKVHQVYTEQNLSYYAACPVSSGELRIYGMGLPYGVRVSDIFPAEGDIFCLCDDDGLWQLTLKDEQAEVQKIVSDVPGNSLSFQSNDKVFHGAAVNQNGQLIHFMIRQAEDGFISTVPFPIDVDVSAAAFCSHSDHTALYYYNTQSSSVLRLLYDCESGNWNEMEVDLPDPGKIQQKPCYSTELTLLDPDKNTPLMDVDVDIWTKQQIYIKTVEGLHICDENHKIRMKTDVQGKISFAQYVNKVEAPVIYASLPDNLMDKEESLAFCQYETVSEKLKGITADQILNARTTDSMGSGQESLLSDEYRNKENAEAIAGSIGQILNMANKGNDCPVCRGVYLIRSHEAGSLGRITPSGNLPVWSLRMEGNRLSYQVMTDAEAAERIAALRQDAIYLGSSADNGLFSCIGDFFRSIAKKIVKVVEVIVQGVKTVVQFVIDSVKYVYELVAGTIGEILDFVEMVFAAVAVFFTGIFAWLAALFQWNDVKRCQRAMEGAFKILLGSAPGMADYVKRKTADYIKQLQDKLDEIIDNVCNQFLPGQSVMRYVEDNTPSDPEAEEAVSNNYLMDRMLQTDVSGALILTEEEMAGYTAELSDILDYIEEFAKNISDSEEYRKVRDYFKEEFSSLDDLFAKLMVSLLLVIKALLHLLLDSCTSLISVMMDGFGNLCSGLLAMITKPIKLPFFSELYKLMVGDEMTLLNMLTFVMSVPAVIISKLVLGAAPFEKEEEVEQFLSDCKQIFDFSGREAVPGKTARKDVSDKWQKTVPILSFSCGCVYNALSAYLDYTTCKEPASGEPPKRTGMDIFVCILEGLWLFFSAPWWKEKVEDYDIGLWVYFTLGVSLDGYFLLRGPHIDKSGTLGRGLTSLYGFIHFCLITSMTAQEKLPATTCIPDMCGGVSEMVKLLIDVSGIFEEEAADEVPDWCTGIVCATDCITSASVLICGIIDACSEKGE